MKHSVYVGLMCGALLVAGCSSKTVPTVAVAPTPAAMPAYTMPAPVIMRPAAPAPSQPRPSAQSSAEKTPVPAAAVPPVPAASQGDFAQQKAQMVAAVSGYQQNRQQKIQAGQDPGPDMFPTYHVDAGGNLYHLSEGTWKLMTDAEIKNPTAAEYGEAQDNLQRAKDAQESKENGPEVYPGSPPSLGH